MRVLTDGIMLGFALGASVYDLRHRTIPVRLLVIYSITTAVCAALDTEGKLVTGVGGMLIGGMFFLISKITNEAIGYGDCWVITLLGAYVGVRNLIMLLFTASFLACLASLIWLWKRGWKRDGSIPFVPFLTLGLLEVIFL